MTLYPKPYTLNPARGFTLLELLIVIGILAILASAAILILNPAELFAQSRDSERINDLGALQKALGVYISTQTTPSLGTVTNCYTHTSGLGVNCGGRHLADATIPATVAKTTTESTVRAVDGTGWVPVDFAAIPGGSPLGNLPIDPSNTLTYFYSYVPAAGSTFEIDAKMESARYKNTGSNDVESKDGGNNVNMYEVGTKAGLSL